MTVDIKTTIEATTKLEATEPTEPTEPTAEEATTTALAIIKEPITPGYWAKIFSGFVAKPLTRLNAKRVRKSLINSLGADLYSEDTNNCTFDFIRIW